MCHSALLYEAETFLPSRRSKKYIRKSGGVGGGRSLRGRKSDVSPARNKEITIGTWFRYRSSREMANDMVSRADDRIDTFGAGSGV